jgi:hypothetical protein
MTMDVNKKSQEQSFTLIEVIISVGMLTAVVLQMVGGQGSVFGMIDYAQRSSEASWLAKRMMSQIEYYASYLDFKELESSGSVKDQAFKFERDVESDYLYSIEIKEWKLPLFDLITGGGPKPQDPGEAEKWKEKKKEGGGPGGIPGLEDVINQIFEGEILKVARVDVSWPEGATRNSVGLTLLLTNQKRLDEYIGIKKAAWDQLKKKALGSLGVPAKKSDREEDKSKLPPTPPGGGAPPANTPEGGENEGG